jgi:soluble epoxide hydrolase/lipid-phosphate phosphatase
MNSRANMAYAARAQLRLNMPVLFMHATYDYVCETLESAKAAAPMRANCPNLTEAIVESGH